MATSIKRNYAYNVSYQIFSLIAPLITAPYIARVLGPENIGILTFAVTVISYFNMFGSLNVNLFGSRELAYFKEDIDKKSEIFWNILFLKIFNLILTLVVLYAWLYFSNLDYKYLFYIESLLIISNIVDFTWVFQAHENFKYITIRNFINKIASIILIFSFVKNSEDLWKYALINVGTTLVLNISLIPYLKNYIKIKKPHIKESFKLFPGIVKVFLPTISISIYSMLDKLMLGILSTSTELGYYEYSQKIMNMSLVLITSITPIMMVRMSNSFKSETMEEVKNYFFKSFKFATFLSFFIFSIIFSISTSFIPWFFGENFSAAGLLTRIISPIIIAISLGTTAGHQFLLSIGKENLLTLGVLVGAVVNPILNFVLIPRYNALGAAISSVVAEISVTIALYLFVSRFVNIKSLFKKNWFYFLFSFLSILCALGIEKAITNNVITFILQGLTVSIIYILLAYIFDGEIRNVLKNYLNRFFHIFNKK